MRGQTLLIALMLLLGSYSYGQSFRKGVLHVKVKSEYRDLVTDSSFSSLAFTRISKAIEATSFNKKFPNQKNPTANRAVNPNMNITDLSLIFELKYDADYSELKAARDLMLTGLFEYAEPAYINYLCYVPNDDSIANQWHHNAINSFGAWDIDKGSSDKVVAIIDTGCDWDHPDLKDAVLLNANDPIDGEDNDGNGYVDDYRGWNFYDDNNEVTETSFSHGTHVGGLTAAPADNGLGVAGTSFASKILVIKAGDKLELTHGYEGIVYAMEMGVDIINCSWGSREYTALGEDIVNAAVDRGIFVIGAAGNNNDEDDFYPASFKNAFSVAATREGDTKAQSSTYNYAIDISAPGELIYSLKNDNTDVAKDGYGGDSGTSMSAPIVAGAAALLLSRYGNLNPRQLGAQLRETARNIDTIPGNEDFRTKLGAGILDMAAAVDTLVDIAIGLENYEFTDEDDEAYAIGDRVKLGIELENYLGQTGVIKAVLEPLDTFASVVVNTQSFSPLGQGQRANNYTFPFEFNVRDNTPFNARMHFKLTITSGSYKTVEYIPIVLNPDFVNITVNDVHTSVSSEGNIGYADFSRSFGLGFELLNQAPLLYEAGLMIGAKDDGGRIRVVDRIRGEGGTDRDFSRSSAISRVQPKNGESFRAEGVFLDTAARSNKIGLEIHQRARAYSSAGHRNYVIMEYDIVNTSGRDLRDVYLGMYADWDILAAGQNFANTVYGKRLGYISSSDAQTISAGIVQLNADKPFYNYTLNNTSDNTEVSLGADGFSGTEKYTTLSNNQFTVGSQAEGVDASHVVSAGSYAIPTNDTISVAFAMLAAANEESLLNVADSAFEKYNGFLPGDRIFNSIQKLTVFPNPAEERIQLNFELRDNSDIEISIINSSGEVVMRNDAVSFFAGANIHDIQLPVLSSGAYFLRLNSAELERTIPLQILQE